MGKTHLLNGRTIHYAHDTEFLVQTGKVLGPYRTIWKPVGNIDEAIRLYNNIKLVPNRKKRLLMPTSSFPTLLQERK